jgi:transposase
MTVSAVARLYGVSPSLVFGWRRRMAEGGLEAVRADEEVVPASRIRDLEAKVRELEHLLGRKTMEAEMLREALEQARQKNVWPAPSASAFTTRSDQSTPTYPVSRHRPGQDGDPRVLVLINTTASSPIFF